MAIAPLRDLSEVLRDGMCNAEQVLAVLANGPRTIPEIAAELHAPPREVTLWVMALRRYGRIADVPRAPTDDYYRYRRTEGGA
jgi:predicted Rossmann fold nucleotide-binding protein DprA/Smf involved in DNA uptake